MIMSGTEQMEWNGNHVFDTMPLIPLQSLPRARPPQMKVPPTSCGIYNYYHTHCVSVCQVSHRSTQRLVNVTVRKQEQRWWDRLTLQERKPLFLAPDFDRWLDESDAEMELQAKVVMTRVSFGTTFRCNTQGSIRLYLFCLL